MALAHPIKLQDHLLCLGVVGELWDRLPKLPLIKTSMESRHQRIPTGAHAPSMSNTKGTSTTPMNSKIGNFWGNLIYFG
jgi:hypothetical protein